MISGDNKQSLTRDAGRTEGSMDAANIMKPALARGNLRRGTKSEE
jgi:hypothetical protein